MWRPLWHMLSTECERLITLIVRCIDNICGVTRKWNRGLASCFRSDDIPVFIQYTEVHEGNLYNTIT